MRKDQRNLYRSDMERFFDDVEEAGAAGLDDLCIEAIARDHDLKLDDGTWNYAHTVWSNARIAAQRAQRQRLPQVIITKNDTFGRLYGRVGGKVDVYEVDDESGAITKHLGTYPDEATARRELEGESR